MDITAKSRQRQLKSPHTLLPQSTNPTVLWIVVIMWLDAILGPFRFRE